MRIELKEIKVGDIYKGYMDHLEAGVVGYNGKLNIRPPFQREFVYKDKQRDAVMDTVFKGFPLNVMYWGYNEKAKEAGLPSYELIDGQQRTLSIMQYLDGDYSVDYRYFHNLTEEEKEQVLNYPLQIYICYGDEKEKLDWFETINIAGEKLSKQELRNASYTGPWLEDAKRYFSRPNAAAADMADGYVSGSPIRQDILELALSWIADRDNITIEEYMARHQQDSNASELWIYFMNVINWAKTLFPKVRKPMASVDWGILYNEYKDNSYNPAELEEEIARLFLDDEVKNKAGIYTYLFDGKEKHLNLRAFTQTEKLKMYESQEGICPACGKHFEIGQMEADHIIPWSNSGKTTLDNGQMLCRSCNREKSNK